ncbi:S41 family peptidase [Aquimarina muelleri]|uniref:Peptidase S41 n=1 Tax=Aquimarina muelleri TaxID=279356 RepID=A0A918N2L0_9FLAO|nr:S41 family peptidase [Aquimarina muelleri]MCX2762682.1 S41 family peptidase [Aquimarina muelleri]GGX05516.1 peptidase S41 [Aquimarina muelleri]
MVRKFLICALVILLLGCSSVKKYNEQISKLHSIEEIQEDIDFTYHKLQRFHPDLYWYISKDSLDKKISTLKQSIKAPVSSIEFYKRLAPVVASIRQGHTAIYSPRKKQSKKEKKTKGKRSYGFKSLAFEGEGGKVFIKKNYGKDSTLIAGSEILSVDNEKTNDLLNYFKKLHTGDGYNTTFIPKYTSSNFGSLYARTHEQKDSLLVTLKTEDNIYSRYVYASYSKENEVLKKDTVTVPKQKISKQDKQIARKKNKQIRKYQYKYGYDSFKKEYNRNFEFITSDTTATVAYMKIRSFTKGGYKDFYKEIFSKVDSAKCQNLILDLRGNLGGRLSEIDELYSYVTDKEYVFVEKAKMTKRMSFLYPFFHAKSWVGKTGAILFSPLLTIYQFFKVKKVKGTPYFKLKYNKLRDPKSNAYTGKIYVLINGESFSASSILSTHLKATKRATFIGEETGGAYNGTIAGLFTILELPNSKINMRLGLMKINAPYTVQPDGFGILPDVYIQSKRDKDQELNWVLQNIKKEN